MCLTWHMLLLSHFKILGTNQIHITLPRFKNLHANKHKQNEWCAKLWTIDMRGRPVSIGETVNVLLKQETPGNGVNVHREGLIRQSTKSPHQCEHFTACQHITEGIVLGTVAHILRIHNTFTHPLNLNIAEHVLTRKQL